MNPEPGSASSPTVVLTADTVPFERALEAALQKYREFANRAEQQAKELAEKTKNTSFLKGMRADFDKLKERADKLSGAGLGFAVTTKAVDLLGEGAQKLRDWVTGAAQYAKALERANQLGEQALALQTKNIAKAREMSEAMGAAGQTARVGALEAELARANDQLATLAARLQGARKASEELSTVWRSDAGNFSTWLGGGLEDARKNAAQNEQEAKKAYDEQKQRAQEIQEQLNRIKNPLTDPEKIRGVEEMVKQLERTRRAVGLTADEAQLLNMELDGFDLQQIDRVRRAQENLAEANIAKKYADVTKELQKQADTYGMTANQAKLYELQQEGFGRDQLERIVQQMEATDMLIARKKKEAELEERVKKFQEDQLKIGESGLVGALGGGSSGAANAIAAARADTSRFANATPEQKAELTRQQQLKALLQNASELQKVGGDIRQLVTLFESLTTS